MLIWLLGLSVSSHAQSGFSFLALLNKKFPVKQASQLLPQSEASFAFLHKSFGNRYENVEYLINHHPNPLTVIVYGDCGPCRSPRRKQGYFKLIAQSKSITSLEASLRRDNPRALLEFQREFDLIARKLPVRYNVRYIFHVGLEDNHSEYTYQKLKVLAQTAFLYRQDIQIGRNPLKFKQANIPIESHDFSMSGIRKLKRGDILVADGIGIKAPSDPCNGLRSDEVRAILETCERKGILALLWRPEHQGLYPCRNITLPQNQRTYKILETNYFRNLLRN